MCDVCACDVYMCVMCVHVMCICVCVISIGSNLFMLELLEYTSVGAWFNLTNTQIQDVC